MPQSTHLLSKLLKGGLALCLLIGMTYGLICWRSNQQTIAGRVEEDAPVNERVVEAGTVELEAKAADRLGIAVTLAHEVQWAKTRRVYGRVVPNPAATVSIDTAAAGRLRKAETPWPTLGQNISAGHKLALLQIRVGPDVRLELQNKLNDSRLRQRGEAEVVKVHTRTVESLQKVTDREILSRAELDTALVNLAEAKIQLAIADAAVSLWEKSLGEIADISAAGGTLWSLPIVAPRGGTVVELSVQPEMEVEAGRVMMRLVDFSRPLVRLDIPSELLIDSVPPPDAQIEAASSPTSALTGIADSSKADVFPKRHRAHFVGPAATVDISSQLVGIWYEVQLADGDAEPPSGTLNVWKPGLQVQTELTQGTSSETAVSVPVSAVLFHEGRSLVYVRTDENHYQRREVRLQQREGGDWIVAAAKKEASVGISAGDAVVHLQAHVLLSKEFLRSGGDTD